MKLALFTLFTLLSFSLPVEAAPAKPGTVSVKQVTPAKFEVSRKALEKELGDGSAQLHTFTALPVIGFGSIDGIRVDNFRHRCLLPRFGIKAGDVVEMIQGIPLRYPGDIMEVAEKLQNARAGTAVRVHVSRDGQELVLSYLLTD